MTSTTLGHQIPVEIWRLCKEDLLGMYSVDKHKRNTKDVCEELDSNDLIGKHLFQFGRCNDCGDRITLLCQQTHNDEVYEFYHLDQNEGFDLCSDCDMCRREAHFEYRENVLYNNEDENEEY